MPPHRVPSALKGKFKEEIDHLIDVGVLTKVEEPTKWVSGAVVTTVEWESQSLYQPKTPECGTPSKSLPPACD